MRAPISVVIPTLNAEAPLTGCLTALMEGLEAGLIRELIISDGGSTDMTLTLAEAWGAEIVSGPASRGGQLRRGCAKAQSDWLLVLHADTRLAPGWTGPVTANLRGDKAGWCQLQFDKAAWQAKRWPLGRTCAVVWGFPMAIRGCCCHVRCINRLVGILISR